MEITRVNNVTKGNIIGFANIREQTKQLDESGDVYKATRYINGIMICMKNGKRWINMPNKPYEKDGETKYQNYCGMEEREAQDRFTQTFFKAYDEYMAKNQSQGDFGASKGQSKESYKDEGVPF